MFKWFHSSIKNKLLIAFLVVGFVPILFFTIYMLFLTQSEIVQKSLYEEKIQIDKIDKIISLHLRQLYHEIAFLSSVEIMDDIVTEDLDKRITILLEKKAKDLQLDVALYVVNKHGKIISSSKEINSSIVPTKIEGFFNKDKKLYFYHAIYASFNATQQLGYLVLEYNLENLELFLTDKKNINTFLLSQEKQMVIGTKVPFVFDTHHNEIIDEHHIVVYKKEQNFLQGWYLVYAVDKKIALAFLYDFLEFILYMIPFILVVIIFISFEFSKKVTTPIRKLTSLTQTITKTKNFDTNIVINTQDEIGVLSNSFNLMLFMTNKALNELQQENKMRLERFIHLVQIFHSIMATKTTQECIEISIQKLKELVVDAEVSFSKTKLKNAIPLEVINYKSGKKEFFGSLYIEQSHLEQENEKEFFLSVAQMITLQLERIMLVDKTVAASEAKSAFISNMSHELRTPLNSIIGFTQYLLIYEDLTPDQQEIIGNIESSSQYLLGMINDILDMAKIEAGKMDVHYENIELIPFLEDTFAMLMPLVEEKNLAFSFNCSLEKNFILFSDPKLYKQVVINLLSNSIKFTKEGSIEVFVFVQENKLYLEVVDSGIGLSKENLEKLFGDFVQVDNVMQKKHKGTGLGLQLSRKMAKLLNGDIILESKGESYGVKATFFVAL